MVLGDEESVLFREVSLFQGLKSTHPWYLGRKKVSCLERCPYFRGVLIERFNCNHSQHIGAVWLSWWEESGWDLT